MTALRSILVLVCTVLVPLHVSATAIYDAFAQATLSITDIVNLSTPGDLSGLSVLTDAEVPLTGELTFGAATATPSGSATALSDGTTQAAGAMGIADSPGFSFAEYLTDTTIHLENTSATDSYSITFMFTVDLNVDVSVMDPVSEFSIAESFVDILSTSGAVDETFELIADTSLGFPSDTFSDTFSFTLSLAAGMSDTVTVLADARGASVATSVPEPATLLLVSCGVLLVSTTRRRSRRRFN